MNSLLTESIKFWSDIFNCYVIHFHLPFIRQQGTGQTTSVSITYKLKPLWFWKTETFRNCFTRPPPRFSRVHSFAHFQWLRRDGQKHLQSLYFFAGFDICPLCAKVVHNICVERFLENRTEANMCHNVQKFINCYEKVGDRYCARWKIVRSFSNLCRQLGEKMLQEDEKHRGLMC